MPRDTLENPGVVSFKPGVMSSKYRKHHLEGFMIEFRKEISRKICIKLDCTLLMDRPTGITFTQSWLTLHLITCNSNHYA